MEGRGETRRVGLAGAGWVTHFHLPAWQRQAHRATIVAIADPDPAARQKRQAAVPSARGYASAAEMLAKEELDVLDVCAPREMHVPLVRIGAAQRIAVLCQKPLAPTLAEAEALVAGLHPGARVMVHDNWRFRATYRRLRQWLDSGLAGELRRVELHYLSSGMIAGADGRRPAIVRQPMLPRLSRLLVMEVLIHQLDALRFLLGELDLVSAVIARSNADIAGEDSATLTLRRRSDGIPVEVVGDLAVHGEPADARDQLRIVGSRGTLKLDGYAIRCDGETSLGERFDPEATYAGSYAAAIGHFLDCLEGGVPFETSPADNLNTLALVEAAYRSAGEFTDGRLVRYAVGDGNRGQ